MDRTEFWRVMEGIRAESDGECERMIDLLQSRLKGLPADQLVQFETLFDELMAESYTWELWAAAYLINGGCSDDGSDYFRSWLIGQGEAIFTNALRDPESLADYPGEFPEYVECEELAYVALQVYEEKTGRDIYAQLPRSPSPREPRGKRWEEDDVETVLPRLAARVKDRFSAPND